jgi:Rrf2 family nitric oxide-sensitive transcriptional repressor
MRLTTFTDYTLRTLLYVGDNPQRTVTVADIADAHGISRNHLTKVVHQMALAGWIDTTRGRGGGIRLSRPPESINIGSVVRRSEIDFYMAECFDTNHGRCIYQNACMLQRMLVKATEAFLGSLDGVTLRDLLEQETYSTITLPKKPY